MRNKIYPNGILFLQETHSISNDEAKWNDEFKGKIYYSHGKSNSCDVLIAFYSDEKINVKKQLANKNSRILILDKYILINLYNSNTESVQPNILEELLSLLTNVEHETGKLIFSCNCNL